jgi:hypothetical protein
MMKNRRKKVKEELIKKCAEELVRYFLFYFPAHSNLFQAKKSLKKGEQKNSNNF